MPGRLVAAREGRFLRPTLPLDTDLLVTVRELRSLQSLGVHSFCIAWNGTDCVTGEISTYVGGH